MNEAKDVVLDLGAASTETKGLVSPNSLECATQTADGRDE